VTAGIGAAIAQQLVKRIGVRTTGAIGMLIAAFGLCLFSGASIDGTVPRRRAAAVIPQSVGMGLFFVPIALIATTNVGEEEAALASGLFNTAQQVGGALGLAVRSTFAADKSASALLVAFGTLLLMLAVRKRDVANVDPDAALQEIVQRGGGRAGTTTPPNRRAPGPAERGNQCGHRWPRGRIAAIERRSARREPVSSPRRPSRRWLGLPHSYSRSRSCSEARCSRARPRRS
jgi:MFS family permease